MICVELRFSDSPERLELRPQHRERLQRLATDGVLVLAGPFGDDSGALLIFNQDEDGVRTVLDDDPYYSALGVTITSVREWTPIAGTAL